MSRDPQQLAHTVGPLLKLAQKKLGVAGLLGLIAAAVLYVAVIQPWAEKRFGVSLPTLVDVDDSPATKQVPSQAPRTESHKPPSYRVEGGDLSGVLTEVGRDTYRSPAGLRYTRGSQHGTRLAHLMSHTSDDPDRVGQHGVYDATDPAAVVLLVDEAYRKALTGKQVKVQREGDQTVYTVDMGRRIGYVGGQSGNRRGKPPADHLRIVVQGDRLITAFPLRP
jgi:hypothetical protein